MRILLCIVVGCCSCRLFAEEALVTYTNAINASSWTSKLSVFECRMEHSVPYYGQAVFRTKAGESSRFYLNAQSSRFKAGKAEVVSTSPVWMAQSQLSSLGDVAVKRGRRPLWIGTKKTEKMLSELNRGKDIEFMRDAWYENETEKPMRLVVGTIGFREEYRKYLKCLAGLLPANFDQLRRTSLYFEPGIPVESGKLTRANMRVLDKVLMLVKHDSEINRFYIDGHASEPGDRTDNLELSKHRANKVAEYLTLKGIPQDALVVRWHGERYPVASNASTRGRAKNRRVTLRLEKMKDTDTDNTAMTNKNEMMNKK